MTGRPFWAYIHGCFNALKGEILANHISNIEAIYRFEAFAALAFGAQGLCWWRVTPQTNNIFDPNDKNIVTGYELIIDEISQDVERVKYTIWAPIDPMGQVTPLATSMQQVNIEVAKAKDVFLGCTVKECRFSAEISIKHPKNYPSNSNDKKYNPLKYFKCGKEAMPFGPLVKLTSPNSETYNRCFLMSLVENGGRTYMVFVNTDIRNVQNGRYDNQSAKVIFTSNMKRLAVGPQTAEVVIAAQTPYTFMLNFGDWAIFEVAD